MLSILANEAVTEHAVSLPMPSFFFGLIAMGAFIALSGITWSYRNVANRHNHKSQSHSAHH